MLVYLDNRLTKEGREAQEREKKALQRAAEGGEGGMEGVMEGGKGGVGTLLNLTCGHNASFSEGERAKLMHHLAQGWTVESFAGP